MAVMSCYSNALIHGLPGGIDNKSGRSYWFNSTIDNLFDLMFNKVLTPKEIYDCLDKEVKSMSDLKEKMLENYESRSSLIEKYM